ncbi:MAG TPA: cellulase family glycosylhydrolase [Povalibacter sp.]|nr:cellulase family glycosylhydrolase [Povalibacter sp.]
MNVTLIGRVRALLCVAIAIFISSNAIAAGYTTANGRIYDASGAEVQVRGISHHGFNSTILQPQFLWAMGWKEQIAQIKSLGFNAVRVPFVPDTLYSTTPVDQLSYVDPARNPELIGKTPLQVLDLWMAEANRVGLYILLDFHSVSMQRQYPTWFVSNSADFGLVYNHQAYTAAQWTRDLAFVAKRYAGLKYFFGIDVYNEPNGDVRWVASDTRYSWKAAAESASSAILAANPNLLVFVQGIAGNFDGVERADIPVNWGEDLQPQAYLPLNIPYNKLVLSPHTYGPDVYNKASFSSTQFPANLAADWDALFGQFSLTYPVVPGEWGGHYGNGAGGAKDVTWQNAFVDYLLKKGIRNGFYWCYTPNSGDTGGILDDNLNVRQDKMTLLKRLWGSSTSTPPPTTTYVQPVLTNFGPRSGPVGTVVALVGTGLTGINQASVNGVAATVKVVSATRVEVTVPSGATSGSIRLANPQYNVSTRLQFKVTGTGGTTPAPTTPPPTTQPGSAQPYIGSFAPISGSVGTVVTLSGSGFSGLTQAWVGDAHNAAVSVVSDTQVKVTIPAGATTGAIGLLNPQHAAFTPTSFTVR